MQSIISGFTAATLVLASMPATTSPAVAAPKKTHKIAENNCARGTAPDGTQLIAINRINPQEKVFFVSRGNVSLTINALPSSDTSISIEDNTKLIIATENLAIVNTDPDMRKKYDAMKASLIGTCKANDTIREKDTKARTELDKVVTEIFALAGVKVVGDVAMPLLPAPPEPQKPTEPLVVPNQV